MVLKTIQSLGLEGLKWMEVGKKTWGQFKTELDLISDPQLTKNFIPLNLGENKTVMGSLTKEDGAA